MIYQAVNILLTKMLRLIMLINSMLRLDLCHYSDAYIVIKGTRNLLADAANENNKAGKKCCS